MSTFDTRAYWEDRLSADWSLRTVGFRRMGPRYNSYAYRLRAERFSASVMEFLPDDTQPRVLDIGSGTGFYIELWKELGASEIVGMELTDFGVHNLRSAFPSVPVVRNDISDGTGGLEPDSFHVASAMDVMFHIVDAERFSAALRHVQSLLISGGYFIWSDLFVHGREVADRHVAFRSLYRVEELLDQAGFEILGRRPLLYWMNEPRDAPPLVLRTWQSIMWLVSKSGAASAAAGRLLYGVDRRLCAHRTESPSTEIMICRKRPHQTQVL